VVEWWVELERTYTLQRTYTLRFDFNHYVHALTITSMSDYSQSDAEPEAFLEAKPKSRQQRWNERHKQVLADARKRYRKSSAHYKIQAAKYQRTYRKKLKEHKAQFPTEPDPWLSL